MSGKQMEKWLADVNQRIADLEEKIEGLEAYLKEGKTIAQCLERNRRDAANARIAESKFRETLERYVSAIDDIYNDTKTDTRGRALILKHFGTLHSSAARGTDE